jgi:hypothetical protein
MNVSIVWPAAVLVLGLLFYYIGNPKASELGKFAFGVALFVVLLALAQQHVRIVGPLP